MKRPFIFLPLIVPVLCATDPAWCGGANTTAFKISVTLPQMITTVNEQRAEDDLRIIEKERQVIQKERLKRGDRLLLVTSIVAR